MPKQIVTPELVRDTAAQLLAAGQEPTLINVRERLGGSYTTVRRYLDQWEQERKQRPSVDVPDAVAAQADLFVQQLWQHAHTIIAEQVGQARSEAAQQVTALQGRLAEAEQVISRQEHEADAQTQRLAEAEAQLAQVRGELQRAQSAAEIAQLRAADLEQRAEELRADLAQAQRQLEGERQARIEAEQRAGGQIAEEIAAMKAQIARLAPQ